MAIAHAEITINTSANRVWQALTDPTLVKQYFFGTNVVSDWEKGSSLVYKGEWEGKSYEDKGTILEIEPNKLLKTTYFSAMSGLADSPENYQVITYVLAETDGKTTITITQDNAKDQTAADHSAANWQMVLEGMKALLEK